MLGGREFQDLWQGQGWTVSLVRRHFVSSTRLLARRESESCPRNRTTACYRWQKLLVGKNCLRISSPPNHNPHKKGKTPQIPSVSVFCNPRTVDLICTFQEQLIVVEDRFLAAQNKNSISQATQFFYLVESSTKEYWLFLSRHEIGPYEGQKFIIPEQHKIIDFLLGQSICCSIGVTGVPDSLE